eukprot:TRINITY_DN23488_c0_g1_i1.p1 TRINITY_DN23488_c0_g1~~TRINITY_DN23488_c0_g1_i1.p1  ORF type:complete len:400 (+),score=137.45 TRINITY_DN23488_c0_g1_i1:120-1202(+)
MTGVGAEFAWRLMKSQGWSDGDGLGKARQGRRDALKPKLKFDQHGLGHDRAAEFEFHWWDHVFNSAVKGVSVSNSESGEITVQFKADKSEISAKKLRRRMQKEMRHKLYSRFIKSGTLEGSKLITSPEEEDTLTEVKDLSQLKSMTDDDLVKACGGRTAHKGARHGQKMNAKLKRVEEAELAFIASIQAKQKEKEAKKKAASKTPETSENTQDHNVNTFSEATPVTEDVPVIQSEKKRKKKKKDKDKDREVSIDDSDSVNNNKGKDKVLAELNEECDKKRKKKEKVKEESDSLVSDEVEKEKKKSKKRKRDKEKIENEDSINFDVDNQVTPSQEESNEQDENLHKKKKKKKNKHKELEMN